jgi:hypothetical protein
MLDEQPLWERCSQDDCIGVRLPASAWCLAHAADRASDVFDAELKRISAEGTVDARGVVITAELLARLLDATPRKDDRPTFAVARFDGASFQGRTEFGGASFQAVARFDRARFQGVAWFTRTSFQRETSFEEATFQGEAVFNQATFKAGAAFDRASFQGVAGFVGASFQGVAGFGGGCFKKVASFRRASFERATQVGPLLARQFVLDDAVFGARVRLDVTAAAVCARRTRFLAGLHLRLRYATANLDDANLAAPAILAGIPSPFPELEAEEHQVARGWARLPPGPRAQAWRPRLVSVRGADVAGLRLPVRRRPQPRPAAD